jgi:DNA-binding beta-propeller fold protein YncE
VKYGGKKYAFDGSLILEWPDTFTAHAFEITGEQQTATYTLAGPANAGAIPASSFVIDDTLYQFSGSYGEGYLSKYALPFTSSPVSPIATLQFANQVQLGSTVVNKKDGIAVALCSRYLNLVNLTTFTVSDTLMAVSGSGKFPGAIVYDQRNNHIYYFQTNYCFAGYCQHIYEFKATKAGKLQQLEESFAANFSQNFNVGACTGCDLDTSTNSIWCLNADIDSLVQFSVSDLNNYTFVPLPSKKYKDDNVAFDFSSQTAYVIFDRQDGFGVEQVSLSTGAVLKKSHFAAASQVVSTSLMNKNKGTLFLGLEVEGSENPHLVIVNMDNLESTDLTLSY